MTTAEVQYFTIRGQPQNPLDKVHLPKGPLRCEDRAVAIKIPLPEKFLIPRPFIHTKLLTLQRPPTGRAEPRKQ